MIGWLVAWKCLVACLFFEESQQPTCPHVRQRRRCTQVSPIFKQRSEEHTSELQSHLNLVCRLLLEKKKDQFFTILSGANVHAFFVMKMALRFITTDVKT